MREPFRLRPLILSLPLILVACGGGYGRPDSAQSQLAFGVDMAKRSLWSEALFRFHQAERLDPNNPRALNNLAVAYFRTLDFRRAAEQGQKAAGAYPGQLGRQRATLDELHVRRPPFAWPDGRRRPRRR